MSREPDLAKQAAWKSRLREFDRGNFTVAEFCRRAGVSSAAFYQWRRKLKPAVASDACMTSRGRAENGLSFLPVEITGSSSVEVLLPNGARLTIPCHDHEAIRTVLATLLGGVALDPQPEAGAC